MSDLQEPQTPQEAMYREAQSAIHSGDRSRARDLLTRLLKMVQDNPEYWIWMSAVVDTPKERIFCLREALRLDPQNATAKRGLILQGMLPIDPALVTPARLQRRNWQSKMAGPDGSDQAQPVRGTQFALMGVALLAVIGLIGFAIWGLQRQKTATIRPTPVVVMDPTNTVVLSADITATAPSTLAPGKPTPLWMLLQATYTPTALYVNTPHPVSEAFRIAQRAFERGEWDDAETYFKQVLAIEPGAADVLYYLGEVYRQQDKIPESIQVFTDIIAKNPAFAPAYVGRARALASSQTTDITGPLKDLETAVDIDPNYGEAYLEFAAIYMQAGQPQKALTALDQAAKLLPDSPLIYLYRAQAYLAMKDPKRALESAQRANQLDMTLLSAYRMIGQTLQSQGELVESLEPLLTYLTYAPEDAQALAWAANAYLAKNDPKEALKMLDRSLRIDNRQEEAYLVRGQLLLDQGKAEDALEDFEAALRFDSESYAASLGVGKALMALKYPGDAYIQFEGTRPLAEEEMEKAEVLFWRAQSLDQLGELDAAVRDWKALAALPATSVKPEWVKMAQQRLAVLVKLTPTLKPKTATPTITVTYTRQPTRTSPPTSTRQPTRTATPTRTSVPTKKP